MQLQVQLHEPAHNNPQPGGNIQPFLFNVSLIGSSSLTDYLWEWQIEIEFPHDPSLPCLWHAVCPCLGVHVGVRARHSVCARVRAKKRGCARALDLLSTSRSEKFSTNVRKNSFFKTRKICFSFYFFPFFIFNLIH